MSRSYQSDYNNRTHSHYNTDWNNPYPRPSHSPLHENRYKSHHDIDQDGNNYHHNHHRYYHHNNNHPNQGHQNNYHHNHHHNYHHTHYNNQTQYGHDNIGQHDQYNGTYHENKSNDVRNHYKQQPPPQRHNHYENNNKNKYHHSIASPSTESSITSPPNSQNSNRNHSNYSNYENDKNKIQNRPTSPNNSPLRCSKSNSSVNDNNIQKKKKKNNAHRPKAVMISHETTNFSVTTKKAESPVFHDPQHALAIKYNHIKHKYDNNLLLDQREKYKLKENEAMIAITNYNNPQYEHCDDDGNVLEPESDTESEGNYISMGVALKDARPRLIEEATKDLIVNINGNDRNVLNNGAEELTDKYEQFSLQQYYKQVMNVPEHQLNGNDLLINAKYVKPKPKKNKKNKKKRGNKNNKINQKEFDIFSGFNGGNFKKKKLLKKSIGNKKAIKQRKNEKSRHNLSNADEIECTYIVDILSKVRYESYMNNSKNC